MVRTAAIIQLAPHVVHYALPQCDHPAQVVGVYLVRDPRDSLPAFIRHESGDLQVGAVLDALDEAVVTASFSASTLSVCSHGRSMSVRPRWP